MRKTVMSGAMALLGVVALAGCGDDAGGETAVVATTDGDAAALLPGTVSDHGSASLGDATSIELVLDDQYFAPTFVDAPAGATVTVTFANEGALPHTFTVDGTDVDEQVGPGETGTATLTLPASGALRFYCRFHAGGGMQGAFVVGGAGATTAAPAPAGGGY